MTLRDYVSLPFTTSTPLDETPGATRNIFFAPDAAVIDAEENATRCAGSVENPTAAPGTLCIYIFAAGNINPNSIDTFAGLQFGTPAGGDRTGFTVRYPVTGAGQVNLRYSWAYTAN